MLTRIALAAAALTAATFAVGQTAPPNMVQMPALGRIDPATGLLRSFDSGKQPIGTGPFFREWFYQFNLDASDGQALSGSVEEGPNYELQDAAHRTIGPLTGPLPRLASGTYYIHVTAAGPTTFRFGVVASPRLAEYPNDAGRTKDGALYLGELTSEISHKNSFYTYFPRQRISTTNDAATGSLTPDFENPRPYAPTPDWYRFTLPAGTEVTLTGETTRTPGETYILTNFGGVSSFWSKGQRRFLDAGTYWVAVVDQATQVIGVGMGGFSFVRNVHVEDFEHYDFRLVVAPSGVPGNTPGTVDLATQIVGINTNMGLGGAPSNVTGPGGTVLVTYRVANLGVPASSAGNVAFYISTTPQLTPASRFVVFANVFDPVPARGSSPELTSNLVLPTDLAAGRYYLFVVANFDRRINETNFANNPSNPWLIEVH